MQFAFEAGFDSGAEHIVALGTDCATLYVDLIRSAFERLCKHASVLAPATDGGYVLIGLSSQLVSPSARTTNSISAFFDEIDWGTDRVLKQSVERVTGKGVSIALLPQQRDVDHPEDLPAWYATCDGATQPRPTLSIIIPSLNTESQLDECIASVRAQESSLGSGDTSAHSNTDVEILVVGAGDAQHSALTAAKLGCQFIQSPPGRAAQMNLGAQAARGEVLLFLHADTRLPTSFRKDVQSALETPGCVGGAFKLAIDSSSTAIRVVERLVQLRGRLFRMPYGDQALFVRRDVFNQLGGFPQLPIMEDYEFVRRLRRRGHIALCNSHALTSDRRWQKLGVVRTTVVNQLMICGYHLGISPQRLAKLYRRKRK
ncbi:MAG: hypothetical protein Aurels2KO_39890 [Aureliella sp.]